MKLGFTSVGVNMETFMQGANPTTQPGVQVTYYENLGLALKNLATESSRHGSASCICICDLEQVMPRITPSDTPGVIGTGVLQSQQILDATIQWRHHGMGPHEMLSAQNGDWTQARAQANEFAFNHFMKFALDWNRNGGMSDLAERMCSEYAGEIAYAKLDDKYILIPPEQDSLYDHLMVVFEDAYRHTEGTEAERIDTALKATREAADDWAKDMPSKFRGDLLREHTMQPDAFLAEQIKVVKEEHIMFGQNEANYHAGAALVYLPEDIRDAATKMFNETMYEFSQLPGFDRNVEQYAALALAMTMRAVNEHVKDNPELAAETAKRCEVTTAVAEQMTRMSLAGYVAPALQVGKDEHEVGDDEIGDDPLGDDEVGDDEP